jgi:hypothetical protein
MHLAVEEVDEDENPTLSSILPLYTEIDGRHSRR